jgi:small subunit ribosomal protein S6
MYETIFILQPELSDDEVKEITGRVEQVISSKNGELKQLADWGVRKLAYPINKLSRGRYYYLRVDGGNDLIAELERRLRLNDKVLRYQTVKLDKDTPAPVAAKAPVVEESSVPAETEEVAVAEAAVETAAE